MILGDFFSFFYILKMGILNQNYNLKKSRNISGCKNYLVHWFYGLLHFPKCSWFSGCMFAKVVHSCVSEKLTHTTFKFAWKPQNKKPSNPGDKGSAYHFHVSLMNQYKKND